MKDVLLDVRAAAEAIPELGYHWPNDELKALGLDVQAQYPELMTWPPYLAAEAHLYYPGRSKYSPTLVPPRSADFLMFLRSSIAP